ncbi:ABC transporter substrate-binding protein [Paludibacterium yongneupense]|uniref:ABC transporter substrate-binding protein n=1 Tax=Paludibacterium yongneupense TaxID=400061 RepID=UPI00040DAAC8|nr:spermidine/putrescine ABC transporter substrate-binding protein [Paludibacterium yongneupense]
MKIRGLLLVLLSTCAQGGDILHLYSGSAGLPDTVVHRFEKECQCRVVQDSFGRGDELVSKLQSGVRYDLVFPSSLAVPALIAQKALQPLDRSRLGNLRNLEPRLLNPAYDRGNVYSLPSALSLVSIGYNIEKLKQLGIDPYSWSVLFDPRILPRLKGHVFVPDRPREVFAAALFYLGRSPLDASEADYRRAADVIRIARAYWSVPAGTSPVRDLVQGNAWLAMGHSSEMFQAREMAREERRGYTIGNVLQKEGNQLSVEVVAVPVAARHPELASQFINFLLDGKNAAELTNVDGAINPVASALPFYREDLKVHPLISPEGDSIRKWSVLRALSPRELALLLQLWNDTRPLPLSVDAQPHGGNSRDKVNHVR